MQTFSVIFPVLALVFAGWGVRYFNLLNKNQGDILAKCVFSFAIPMLLFINTANAKLPDSFQWQILVIYYGAALIIYSICLLIGKTIFRYNLAEQSSYGMGAAYSNTTVIGIPICLQALGKEALLPLFTIITLQSLIMFTFGIVMLERLSLSKKTISRVVLHSIRQLIQNPITASLLAGMAFNIAGLQIYPRLNDALMQLSNAAIPAALFALGCSLHSYKLGSELGPATIMAFSKLVGMPLLVWLFAFHVFTLNSLWATTVLIASAMPVGISAYIFAKNIDAGESTTASGILLSSVFSIVSISVILGAIS